MDTPISIDGSVYSAANWRRSMNSALLAHDTATIAGRSGVLGGGAPTISARTVTIPDQHIVFADTGTNGNWIVYTDPTAASVDVADTTNPRIDLIYAKLWDTNVDGSGKRQVTIEIAKGTPAATPSTPALPARCVSLASVLSPVTGNPTVTDTRQFTALGSSTLPVANLSGLSTGAMRMGQLALDRSTGKLSFWTGSAWSELALKTDSAQNATVTALTTRVSTLESTTVPGVDARVKTLEGKNLDTRITTLENTTVPGIDGRVKTLENTTVPGVASRVTTLEGKNLDSRVTTLEGKNLDSRVTTLEGKNLDSRVTTLETAGADSGWVSAPAFENGWVAVSGYPLQIRRVGNMRFLRGMARQVTVANVASNIITLPAGDRPSGNMWLGGQVTDTGVTMELLLQSGGGMIFPSSYRSASPGGAVSVGLFGTWIVG